MDKKTFKKLDTGDIVRHKASEIGYMVTGNFGDRVTAIRTADITNPEEWEMVNKVVKRK